VAGNGYKREGIRDKNRGRDGSVKMRFCFGGNCGFVSFLYYFLKEFYDAIFGGFDKL